MFETLTKGFRTAKQKFQGLAELDEATVDDALKEVRTALLEADVGFDVVQDFCKRVREKAVGVIVKVKASSNEKMRRVTPEDHFVKLCHDELVDLMGPVDTNIKYAKKGPTGIMLVGLQGSGKTTTIGKLALYLEKKHKRPLLVAADVYRPAAIEQLQIIGKRLDIPVYAEPGGSPPDICEKALRVAAETGRDVILFDTAGRLAIDEPLMQELEEINKRARPANILLIVDAMIGQDAVTTAKVFNQRLDLDGVILTKLDGDARGGAALSVKAVTGKPIKFVGMGESSERLEEFRPDGMASRILGRGDVVGLIQQFEEVVDEEKAEQDAVRMLKGKFDMNDFLEQIGVLKKMGSLSEMVEKIPGVADAMPEGTKIDDGELVRIHSMISSMTDDERRHPERFVVTSWEEVVDGGKRKKKRSAFYDQGRLRRVARGCGHKENEVADLLNRFAMMRQMMMQIGMSTGLLGKIPGFKQLAQMKKFAGIDVNQLASMMNTPSAERGHFQAPKRNVDRGKEKRKRKDARKARKKGRQRR
ncbi:MAG: signal recognition particle subunit [Myxococcales bacterium]|jgi:signal recognition particle subunit SRP54|nr:signal recognition particle subunit [Myxococcales bacterium]